MIRKEHFREEIDQINIGMLNAPSAAKWVKAEVIRIRVKRNRVIQIIRGSFTGTSVIGGKRRQWPLK